MRAMEVIVMKVVGKEGSSVVTGVIRTSISPLAGDGLDEAFRLAVCLRAIGFSEEMGEAEFMAGSGEELGAIGWAAIGEELLDGEAVSGVEAEGQVQSLEDALGAFVREETGEGEAGVIIDGDVETFDAGAWIAEGAVTGGAHARAIKAAELLDIEVEKFAGRGAFVAPRRRFGRIQSGEPIEVMTAQDAGESGLGDRENHHNLSVGASLAAQSEDLGFELRSGLAGLTMRHRRTIDQASGKAALFGASQPATDGLFADAEGDGSGTQGEAELRVLEGHLGPGERSKSGISVHVDRAQERWVES
jgi:hypothetical protein